MATNQRGHGLRVRVTVSAARSSGDFVIEDGFHGVMVNDVAAIGDMGVMDIAQVEHEVPMLAGATLGAAVYIPPAGGALTLTATGNRLVGKVTRIDGDEGVGTGMMWMLVLPQAA